jgi:hypothetical protein
MSRTRKPPKKSASERLRAVFYQHHNQSNTLQTFDEYYEEKMEMLIEHYKKLLIKK